MSRHTVVYVYVYVYTLHSICVRHGDTECTVCVYTTLYIYICMYARVRVSPPCASHAAHADASASIDAVDAYGDPARDRTRGRPRPAPARRDAARRGASTCAFMHVMVYVYVSGPVLITPACNKDFV
jgi:hypothetical protein